MANAQGHGEASLSGAHTGDTVGTGQGTLDAEMSVPLTFLEKKIISWNAGASIKSNYSATMQVTDELSELSAADLTIPIELALEATGDSAGITGDPTLLFGTKTWLRGLIASIDNKTGLSERGATINIKSFFARLGRKPVNTTEENDKAIDLLNEIASTYAALPPALYDLQGVNLPVCPPVSSNNMLDAMRLVAQAGKAHLFVNEEGWLRSRVWKDSSDPVDTVIPDEIVVSANRLRDDEPKATRLKIRGCYFTVWNKGEQPMDDDGGGGGGGGGGRGKTVKCAVIGVPQVKLDIVNNNLRGDENDLQNASITTTEAGTPDPMPVTTVSDIEDARMNYSVENSENNGGFFSTDAPGQGEVSFEMEQDIRGRIRPRREYTGTAGTGRPARGQSGQSDKAFKTIVKLLGAKESAKTSGPAGGGGGGGGGSGAHLNPNIFGDEPEEIQIEMQVDDTQLQSEFGIIVEQIENIYVPDRDTLFEIGIRRFQEIKMERNAWQVNISYMRGIQLYDVVTFKTPPLKDGTRLTITGLLVAIRTTFTADPINVKQVLVVESFEDIGSTQYQSPNLIKDRELTGEGSGTDWTSSVSNITNSVTLSDPRAMIRVGSGEASLILTQQSMVIGDTYTLEWDQEGVDLDVTIVDIQGVLSTGPFSVGSNTAPTFVCRETTTRFIWESSTAGRADVLYPKLSKLTTPR